MVWDPYLKISLVMALAFLVMILGFLLISFKVVGNMGQSLERFEELVAKEVVASFKRRLILMKKENHRRLSEVDRQKRQSALLNVPLRSTARPGAKKD